MIILNKKNIDGLKLFNESTRITISNFIHKLDSLPFEKGKIADNQSDLFCFAQEYFTHPFDKCGWERHKLYYDVQYIQSGEELVYYNPCEPISFLQVYDDKTDCETAVASEGEKKMVGTGDIVIFEPGEFHNTGVSIVSEKRIIKFVIKCKGIATGAV